MSTQPVLRLTLFLPVYTLNQLAQFLGRQIPFLSQNLHGIQVKHSQREDLGQNLRTLVMPAFVLGNALAAVLIRHTRSAMLQVLSTDYVRTARAKGLVEKLPRSRRYCLPAEGYSVCLIFLKLFDRLYAPLTAALLHPIPADATLPAAKRSRLDRLYQCLTEAIDRLVRALGLALSSPINENKILVDAPITA